MGSTHELKESLLPTLSLKVSEELDQSLAALARRRGVNKTALIRDALADFVARGTEEGSPAGVPAKDEDVDEYGW